VRGIEVGHAQNEEALTGCTVILCRKGAGNQSCPDGVARYRAGHQPHTMMDGDVVFALSTGTKKADVSTIGAFAAKVMAEVIL
jgi:L-aminopeptidase/D-esterase-like protein